MVGQHLVVITAIPTIGRGLASIFYPKIGFGGRYGALGTSEKERHTNYAATPAVAHVPYYCMYLLVVCPENASVLRKGSKVVVAVRYAPDVP